MKILEINSIDEYIALFTEEIQKKLKKIRETIKKAAPHASEVIKYQMPTFVLHENLVHFAAFKKHIGFFPTPSGVKEFENELTAYKTSKGTIQFQNEQPIPYELIKKITSFRVNEAIEKHNTKKKKKIKLINL